MIRQRNRIRSLALYIGDLVATVSAFLLAYGFRGAFPEDLYASLFPLSFYLDLFLPILPIWSLIFYLMELYQYWRGPGFWKETWKIFSAVFISSFLLGFFVFALKYQFVSRIFILSFAFYDFLLVIFFRYVTRKVIQLLNRQGESSRAILIVGTGDQALELVRGIEKHRDLGLQIMRFSFHH